MMDLEHFLQAVNHPARTKEELITMRDNARQRDATDHARAAEDVLFQRFPGWNRVRSRRGGATPTDAQFLGKQRHFDTAKDAYIWLIERFLEHHPKPFIDLDWETVYLAKNPRTLVFARTLEKLFRNSLQLIDNPNCYHQLTNGWFARVVLNNRQKLEILRRFGTIAALQIGKDWSWNAGSDTFHEGDTEELLRQVNNI